MENDTIPNAMIGTKLLLKLLGNNLPVLLSKTA